MRASLGLTDSGFGSISVTTVTISLNELNHLEYKLYFLLLYNGEDSNTSTEMVSEE